MLVTLCPAVVVPELSTRDHLGASGTRKRIRIAQPVTFDLPRCITKSLPQRVEVRRDIFTLPFR